MIKISYAPQMIIFSIVAILSLFISFSLSNLVLTAIFYSIYPYINFTATNLDTITSWTVVFTLLCYTIFALPLFFLMACIINVAIGSSLTDEVFAHSHYPKIYYIKPTQTEIDQKTVLNDIVIALSKLNFSCLCLSYSQIETYVRVMEKQRDTYRAIELKANDSESPTAIFPKISLRLARQLYHAMRPGDVVYLGYHLT